ncbi:MAG: type II toxin-antitoxin system RelE/ParE family toxin [Candidatus Methylomirabilales bacterium]
MTIVVSPQAQEDLRQAYQQIAQDNREAADRVLARIVEVIGMLASGVVEGREVYLRDGRRVYTWPVPPYRVYYRKSGDVFQIVRVYHQARRPIER